ncbi:MAG: hypothetical protein U9Q03_02870 [Patescibacteria group bacterium]|nr:hypothetical protein [Patescibacteria group bacterium]
MYDERQATQTAESAAATIRNRLSVRTEHPIGLILGTGWGDALNMDYATRLPFDEIPGFGELRHIEGHDRVVECGDVAGRETLLLRGRVHLNEHPSDPNVPRMVRLQTEMLMQAGVNRLIVTCAAGSLNPLRMPPGGICITDGFVTGQNMTLPSFGGEFDSPEDALDPRLIDIARYEGAMASGKRELVWVGGHAYYRGPNFEGRKYEKNVLASTGALTVGMSTIPALSMVAKYKRSALASAFISNDNLEVHTHEENLKRAKESADFMAAFLEGCISNFPTD